MAWTLECIRGEQDPFNCCGGAGGVEIFSGLRITTDVGVQTRISFPFDIYRQTSSFVLIDYRGNFIEVALDDSSFADMDAFQDFLVNCKSCQCSDSGGEGPFVGLEVFRQRWPGHSANQVRVSVNGGTLPADESTLGVYFNGRRLTYNTDYIISGSDIFFNFDVDGDLIEVVFFVDGSLEVVARQNWTGVNTQTLTVSANGGVIPANHDQLLVFYDGRLLLENTDFTVAGSEITFLFNPKEGTISVIIIDDGAGTVSGIETQVFQGISSQTVTVTNAAMPVDTTRVLVFFNGRLLTEANHYTISGSDITMLFEVVESTISVLIIEE